MSSGWKFSVTLPSWTQATLEGDELVVVSLISFATVSELTSFLLVAESCIDFSGQV